MTSDRKAEVEDREPFIMFIGYKLNLREITKGEVVRIRQFEGLFELDNSNHRYWLYWIRRSVWIEAVILVSESAYQNEGN